MKVYNSINRKLVYREMKKVKLEGSVLDIGAKDSPYSGKTTVKLDAVPHKGVDIVADAHNLPFKDKSFDNVLLIEVLEHLKNPTKAVSEIHRVMGKGKLVLAVPFMYPFHADPYDYQRFTHQGLRNLLKNFRNVKITHLGNLFALIGTYVEFIFEKLKIFSWLMNIFLYLDKIMPIYKNTVIQYFVEAEK